MAHICGQGNEWDLWNIQFGMSIGMASCGQVGGSSHLKASIWHLM